MNNSTNPNPPVIKGGLVVQTKEKWVGLCKNSEANPTLFGPEIWELLQKHCLRVPALAQELLKYGYWEDYKNNGYCDMCGKSGLGHVDAAAPLLLMKISNGEKIPDPLCLQHRHVPHEPVLFSENAESDGLWYRWIYNIRLDEKYKECLEILYSVRAKGTHLISRAGRSWQQDSYQYFSTGIYCIHGNEPNWEEIEHKAKHTDGYYHQKFSSHQSEKKTPLC